jgi:hypothetical protein
VIYRRLISERGRNGLDRFDALSVFFNVCRLICGDSHTAELIRLNKIAFKRKNVFPDLFVGADVFISTVGFIEESQSYGLYVINARLTESFF